MLVCTHCRIALREHETQCPRDGHPGEEATFADLPVELKARFDVVEPFAQGLTGSLWLVDDRESGRRGLLKLLHESDAYRPADRQRIRREWTKQATLDSPHLANVFESGDVNGQLWCLREWVDGVSLAARLAQGRMERDDVLQMSGPLAAALDALHRAGLLHRDVKPGHIVLAPQPGDAPTKVVLVDAGSPSPLKGAGGERLWGTPAYLAPEQSAGKLVSFRSDLYSFGCVLYEALEGAPPFVDDDALEVVRMHREHDAPEPPADLPEDLAKLMRSLLAKEAQQRPFSAQKVRKSLAPHLANEPAEASATQTFATRGVAAFAPTSWSKGKPSAPAKAPAVSAPPPVPPAALSTRPSRGAASMAPPPRNGVSMPPPVPPAARKSSRPPVRPPSTRPPSDATQPLEIEQIVSMRANLSAPPPVPPVSGPPSTRSADHTLPLDLDQIVAVNDFYRDAPRSDEGMAEQAVPELDAEALEAESLEEAEPADASEEPAAESEAAPDAQAPAPQASAAPTADVARPEPAATPEPDAEPPATADAEPSAVDAPPAPIASAPVAAVSEAIPNEATVPAAHLTDVRVPEEEPRPADDLIEGLAPPAPAAGAAGDATPSFVDALAGPDSEDDEEDESPTHVVSVRHVAAAAGMQAAAAGAAAMPAEDQPPPPTYWDDMNGGGAEPDAWGEPRATRQAETTKVTPNPFASPEQRNRLMMFGGGAVVFLALLIWMFSGDDEPELAGAEGDAETEQAEAQPSAAAAAEQEEAPSPAMAPAPEVEPVAEAPEVAEPQEEEGAEEDDADALAAEDALAEDEDEPEPEDEADEEDAPQRAEARPSSRRGSSSRSRSSAKPARSSRSGIDTATWERARAEARAHYRMRKYDRAERAYAEAAAANPKHAGTFAGLGAARLAQGKAKPAAQAYRRAVQLEPRNSAFHSALGAAYAQAGDKRRARREYSKALQLDQGNRAAKAGLAKL